MCKIQQRTLSLQNDWSLALVPTVFAGVRLVWKVAGEVPLSWRFLWQRSPGRPLWSTVAVAMFLARWFPLSCLPLSESRVFIWEWARTLNFLKKWKNFILADGFYSTIYIRRKKLKGASLVVGGARDRHSQSSASISILFFLLSAQTYKPNWSQTQSGQPTNIVKSALLKHK